jgi:hypothetical protein
LREPQLEPSDHAYTILQDYGPGDGGWGPAAIAVPGLGLLPAPFVYTGSDERTIARLPALARKVAQDTGRRTILARYSGRQDVLVIAGSS